MYAVVMFLSTWRDGQVVLIIFSLLFFLCCLALSLFLLLLFILFFFWFFQHILLSNRCQSYFKLGELEKALHDAMQCILLAPTFGKGYLRRASVLDALHSRAAA